MTLKEIAADSDSLAPSVRRKTMYKTESPNNHRSLVWAQLGMNSVARATVVTLSLVSTAALLPDVPAWTRSCPQRFRVQRFPIDSRMLIRMSTFAELDVEQSKSVSERFTRIHPVMKSGPGGDLEELDDYRNLDLANHRPKFPQYSIYLYHSLPITGDENYENRIQFKGVSAGPYKKQRKKLKLTISERRGRVYSSTMPGFGVESDRLRAHRDGIRIAEIESGRKSSPSAEAEKQRKRQSGEALYRNSGAVPESLMRFADDIHKEDRISRKEEIQLGELTQEAVRLQQLYERLKDKLNREPTDNEWCAASGKINMMAIEQAIQDGFEAKNRLVASNLRIVQSVVNIYLRNGLSAQYNAGDMMQEGILALIRAAEKFEPDRGWKFSTYAMYWVRASVKRNQVAQSRPVPVPHRVYENHKRLLRTQRKLELSMNRKPTKKELGEAVGMSELQVERCFKAMQQKFYSLDQEIRNTKRPMGSNERNDRLVEIVEARVVDDEFSLKAVSLREAFVETLRRHLNSQEVELLMLRYGLKDCPGQGKVGGQPTIAELSCHLNLTPDRVRRIIKKALIQLKEVDPQEWLVFKEELC
ncbi:hypothetical protein ACA910_016808 [Epithemia clementina (nom. ined.)]